MQETPIESYRNGYPRYSALIAADDSFHLCRRFSNLRARLLLTKQDEISELEEQLEQIDREETVVPFLASIRHDNNNKRRDVLSRIDTALTRYDALVERNHKMLSYRAAGLRHVVSLQNWVNNNACLARAETAYLTYSNDLLSVAPSHDGASERMEAWVEDKLVRYCKTFQKGLRRNVSNDSSVFIFSGSLTGRLTRIMIILLTLVFLLAPAIICNILDGKTVRTTVVVVAVILFLVMLSAIAKARTIEILVAGTTYATVLFVFISGANLS
ncbi:hypothetical protein K469DRAFT_649652 [Zopfia rhizophila CBS 207.26]|uniref:DUF6594 domain-containing protein n=1 Tax=Zopfia rhizophila CBS 207.26 TaxID=1314779 RepID=A0A6A6ETV3_9PEZI|nr:hypothetical protein K469DRAFT_649652 [Zopfia rhizophila CBS 207.26]